MGSSYLVPLSPASPNENGHVRRLSQDIIREICKYLASVRDVVAFCQTCKFVYQSIAPLFTFQFHDNGTDWSTFCMRGNGDPTPIQITHLRGGKYVYVIDGVLYPPEPNDVFCWENFHLNKIIERLETPQVSKDGIEYVITSHFTTKNVWIGAKRFKAYAAYAFPDGKCAKYMAKGARKLLTRLNKQRFKKKRKTSEAADL
jgi:hypothetical protein